MTTIWKGKSGTTITSWKGKSGTTITSWEGRKGKQSDRGFLTDDIGNVLASNTLSKISFHIGIFVNAKTKWINAR